MTGAKVFRLLDLHDEEVEVTGSGVRLPRPRKPPNSIRLSEFYYGQQVRVLRVPRTVYLCSPQQGSIWPSDHLIAELKNDWRVNPGNGIHAYRNLRGAVRAQQEQDHQVDHPGAEAAYAIVRAEGPVVIGEYGWVAKAVTILRIFLMPKAYLEFSRMLYDRYRVPVEVLPRSVLRSVRERHVELREEPFQVWNRRYGPESGAYYFRWRRRNGVSQLHLVLPQSVRRPANIAVWDAGLAAMAELRMAARRMMTAQDWGRLGGMARGRALRAGLVPVSGAAVARPTVCIRCGKQLPSAREAWRHCRGKAGRPKKDASREVT